jgi:hypothetical protein
LFIGFLFQQQEEKQQQQQQQQGKWAKICSKVVYTLQSREPARLIAVREICR